MWNENGFVILLYLHLILSESLISREGFHGIPHEGCFICKVQESDVKRDSSGVIFVNQRPTALQNTHRKNTNLNNFCLLTTGTSYEKHVNIQGTPWDPESIG